MLLLRPVPSSFKITQNFGENPALYPSTKGHNGIDYGTPEGVEIRAAADGEVTFAGLDPETQRNPMAGYGFHVRIVHAGGMLTIYGHMQAGGILVQAGQQVSMGQPIGRTGNTGRSTGPHLHFELRSDVALISAVDPAGMIVEDLPEHLVLMAGRITPEGDLLNLRTGPGTARGVIRTLKAGEAVQIFGLAGTDVWLRTADGYIKYDPRWISLTRI